MTRVLVTGVAGFIGSHVAEHCRLMGFNVVGIDDLSGGSRSNVPAGVDFRMGSVTDPAFVESLWRDGAYDYVYHLAAYAAEGLSHYIRRFNYETNLIGSVNLINQCVLHDVRCFVFASSIAVYGANQTPMTEELVPRPEDPYGVSKYAVELDLAAAHQMFDLPFVIFRPHNVYGERQNITDKYRNVIGIFMNQVMQGKAMTIFGDGLQTRAFSHVDDVARPIARAPLIPAAYQQIINIGADRPCTVLDIAREVARAFHVDPQIEHLEPRNEVLHAVASHDKARRIFGSVESISLGSGIDRMAHWARSRGPMPTTDFGNIEIKKNLPMSWVR
jgi:UDP-glucose 4-epimerase